MFQPITHLKKGTGHRRRSGVPSPLTIYAALFAFPARGGNPIAHRLLPFSPLLNDEKNVEVVNVQDFLHPPPQTGRRAALSRLSLVM